MYRGQGHFELDPEAPVPRLGEGEVLVKVRYCGVCGSDLHLSQNIARVEPGDTLGHEISGVIAEVGAGFSRVKPGDRVTAHCAGGYADFVKTTEDRVIPLPESVTFEQAALSEPFAVGLRSVRDSGLKAGDRAGVIGAGPIGLMALLAAKLAGALEVYVCEVSPARIEAARRLGAAAVFNPKTQDAAGELQKLAPDGLDVVYDCAGAPGTLELALRLLKRDGTVMVVGLSGLPDQFNARWLMVKHARIMSVPGAAEVWPLSVQLIGQGRVDPSAIVSHVVPIEELPRYLDLLMDPAGHVQVLVDPWGDRF